MARGKGGSARAQLALMVLASFMLNPIAWTFAAVVLGGLPAGPAGRLELAWGALRSRS
jgi:hypothetical protein